MLRTANLRGTGGVKASKSVGRQAVWVGNFGRQAELPIFYVGDLACLPIFFCRQSCLPAKHFRRQLPPPPYFSKLAAGPLSRAILVLGGKKKIIGSLTVKVSYGINYFPLVTYMPTTS